MCYDGVWGTVCNSGWETAEARVVCRQLGYSSSGTIIFVIACWIKLGGNFVGAVVDNSNTFGPGSGPVVLRYVACRGDEFKLLQCANTALDSSCSHTADAGVRCAPGEFIQWTLHIQVGFDCHN